MTGIYSNIVEAKDGTLIPVFKSNQTMYSKYYPAKDADFFLKNCKEDEKQFFLICGIGNGLHIKALRNKFPKAKILAFESYQEDLNFLETNFNINQMSKEYLFDICLQEDIPKNIINKYVPIIHGNFSMLQQRAWADNNKENLEKITLSVNQVLEEISADISTQGYFGKIWHRNIIQNLLLAPEINQNPDVLNTKKTEALIVAAGPSLDLAIEKIQSDTYIKNQFIISTDTALPVLYKNNIQPDMVVTIDGQIISRLHFIGKLSKETCIAADLSCCPTIIRQAINQKYPIIFTRSNHPLASIISKYFYDEYKYEITNIYSGSGTVTIAAVDIAINMGFKKINVTGADFAYINGQAYAKGTYFDEIIFPKTSKINTYEQEYHSTFFNKKLIKNSNGTQTTYNLKAYHKSFEEHIKKYNFIKENNPDNSGIQSYTTNLNVDKKLKYFIPNKNQCTEFIEWYLKMLQEKNQNIFPSVLPLATWYKRNNNETDIFSSLKLAYYLTVRYNSMHGK